MTAHSTVSRETSPGDESSSATALFAALRSAYREVDQRLAELEKASTGPKPDMAALVTARFRMSHARHAKRQLVQKACELLLPHATVEELQSILCVRRENADYFRASTEHVRHWTPDALQRDWARFCEESRKMRLRMKHLSALEQRLLLPMLARHQRIGGA